MPQGPKVIKGRKVTGLPVLEREQGSTLGAVRELLYDDEGRRVEAVLLEEGSWFKGAKVVRWGDVLDVTENGVTVPSQTVIQDTREEKELADLSKHRQGLRGYKLINDAGEELGIIEDILFDPVTGHVLGCELSQGVVQDLLEGRWEALLPEDLVVRENTLLISQGEAEIFQPDSG
ncbi:MAG TPA: PRC-barrel domain-containing protein [Bacillota bacterium]|nr:PRC-barrel domain-containing protein [Bacillota bacterium]